MGNRRLGGPKTARNFLNNLESLCSAYAPAPPYLHVSSPIGNSEELKQIFSGQKLCYARFPGHPDHIRLEKWLARFEGGGKFRVRADGMNAIRNVIDGAGEVGGSHFILILPLYGGTYDLAQLLQQSPRHNFSFTFLYANDPDLLNKLNEAINSETAGVIFEIAGNPTLPIPDVEGIMSVCKNHPIKNPMVICDDTFLFGLFKPFRWGIDGIVGSGTKYPAGESAWPLGYYGASDAFLKTHPEFWVAANTWSNLGGGTQGIIEAWITERLCAQNIRQRIKKHSSHAMTVAMFLETHPKVERVIYPGLFSYPWRERALRYLEPINGEHYFGGMISFYLKGNAETAEKFLYRLTNTSHIQFKASLAGPDDMIESAHLLSHKNMSAEDKRICEITPNLIRLSVGRLRSARETMEVLDRSL